MSLAHEWKSLSYPEHGEEARRREEKRRAEQLRRKNKERARRMRLLFCSFLAVALLMCGILMLCIFLHVKVAQNEISTREAERQIELERRRQDAARAEISSLESPGRIEREAVEKLHMVQASTADYLETAAYRAAAEKGDGGIPGAHAMAGDTAQGGN
ncbi:MAG: hypothetical protein H5T73_10440 [Actinobacteria bacterium]|nr:hypothetical protein [Actinomycetota bacterium]